jgi:hypothetical protein
MGTQSSAGIMSMTTSDKGLIPLFSRFLLISIALGSVSLLTTKVSAMVVDKVMP